MEVLFFFSFSKEKFEQLRYVATCLLSTKR